MRIFFLAVTVAIASFLAVKSIQAQEKLPRIKVLATGGTIANTPSGRLHAGEVVEAIPQLKEVARLEVEELMRVGSSAITVANWLALAKRINEILAKDEGVKAVVVTHGSNTVEETAYFLGLTVRSDKPVVLTAAQRQFSTLSSDSPKNFLQAVRVAASDAARGKGALVVTNDTIIAAREVTKEISYRLETYSGKDLGVLGFVDDDRVTFYRQPVRKHNGATPFDVGALQKLPRVDIVYTYADADGVLAEAAVERGKAEGWWWRRFRPARPARRWSRRSRSSPAGASRWSSPTAAAWAGCATRAPAPQTPSASISGGTTSRRRRRAFS